jgi:hypothetical protein
MKITNSNNKSLGTENKSTLEYITEELRKYLNSHEKQKYNFYILSCYLNIDVLKDLRNQVSDCINTTNSSIVSTTLFIDRDTALQRGHFERLSQEQENQDNSFKVKVPNHSLFHPKAYALISTDSNQGIIFIGSANLTRRGMKKDGNTELMTCNLDNESVSKFIRLVGDIDKKSHRLQDAYDNLYENGLVKESQANAVFKLNLVSQGFIFKRTGGTKIEKAGLKIQYEYKKEKGTVRLKW